VGQFVKNGDPTATAADLAAQQAAQTAASYMGFGKESTRATTQLAVILRHECRTPQRLMREYQMFVLWRGGESFVCKAAVSPPLRGGRRAKRRPGVGVQRQ